MFQLQPSPWLLFSFLILVSKLCCPELAVSMKSTSGSLYGKIIATLHIKYQQDGGDQDANRKVREIFHNAGIHNVTIQFEKADLKGPLGQKDLQLLCSSPCIAKSCAKQLCCPLGPRHWPTSMAVRSTMAVPLWTCPRVMAFSRRQTTEVAVDVS